MNLHPSFIILGIQVKINVLRSTYVMGESRMLKNVMVPEMTVSKLIRYPKCNVVDNLEIYKT